MADELFPPRKVKQVNPMESVNEVLDTMAAVGWDLRQVQERKTNMATYEERRDTRFYGATITALKDIEDRLMQLPLEERYAGAYGVLRGYFESLLVNFAEAFSTEQLAEIRIVLDQLSKVTGEDEHLDEATKTKLDQLAQALRESE